MTAKTPLHTYGDARLLEKGTGKKVAVIGSRHVSDKALKQAYNISHVLAKAGCTIVNGMALGTDTAALTGALSADGKSLVFLPCGRDIAYPASNRKLYERILKKGCIASEFEDGTAPQKYRFIARDRLQAEYADCIIVIDCSPESGTMHTVKDAYEMGKPIAVISDESGGAEDILSEYSGKRLHTYRELIDFVKTS